MINNMKKLPADHDNTEMKQLNRHYAILSREIAIDNSDKDTLEKEFETYIERALLQYGEVLRLSCEPDNQTVSDIVTIKFPLKLCLGISSR